LKSLIFSQEDKNKADADALAIQNKAASELLSFNNSLLSLSESLRGAIVGIYGTEVATSKLSLTAALESARLGDFSKALDLNLSNLNPSMEGFESLEAFNIEQAITANKLAELADLAGGTASIQDMTLTANQEQVNLLTSINTNIASAYVPQQTSNANNDNMIAESKALNLKVVELMRENNELIRVQNRFQAESANSLDNIEKNGVGVAA
jgi:mannose/fructose-specific phosphotransferase system component IIA